MNKRLMEALIRLLDRLGEISGSFVGASSTEGFVRSLDSSTNSTSMPQTTRSSEVTISEHLQQFNVEIGISYRFVSSRPRLGESQLLKVFKGIVLSYIRRYATLLNSTPEIEKLLPVDTWTFGGHFVHRFLGDLPSIYCTLPLSQELLTDFLKLCQEISFVTVEKRTVTGWLGMAESKSIRNEIRIAQRWNEAESFSGATKMLAKLLAGSQSRKNPLMIDPGKSPLNPPYLKVGFGLCQQESAPACRFRARGRFDIVCLTANLEEILILRYVSSKFFIPYTSKGRFESQSLIRHFFPRNWALFKKLIEVIQRNGRGSILIIGDFDEHFIEDQAISHYNIPDLKLSHATVGFVAELCGIDGAVFCNQNKEIVGFGCILKMYPEIPTTYLKGARHQAAEGFINHIYRTKKINLGAMVVSEDGPVSCFKGA